MKIIECRNAKWNEPERITFDCEIQVDEFGSEWLPFTFNPSDQEPHVIEFKETCVDNGSLVIADISQAEYDQKIYDLKAFEVRGQRDFLLAQSDTYVLPDRWAAMTAVKQQEWTDYRQALRDVTDQSGFPFNVVWPVKPE